MLKRSGAQIVPKRSFSLKKKWTRTWPWAGVCTCQKNVFVLSVDKFAQARTTWKTTYSLSTRRSCIAISVLAVALCISQWVWWGCTSERLTRWQQAPSRTTTSTTPKKRPSYWTWKPWMPRNQKDVEEREPGNSTRVPSDVAKPSPVMGWRDTRTNVNQLQMVIRMRILQSTYKIIALLFLTDDQTELYKLNHFLRRDMQITKTLNLNKVIKESSCLRRIILKEN